MENNAEIQALEEQIKNFKDQQEQASKKEEYDALQKEIDAAESKLAVKRAEIEQHEKAIDSAQESISTALEAIEVDGEVVALRDLCKNEGAYQLLSIYIKKQFVTQAEKFNEERATIRAGYEQRLVDAKVDRDDLQGRYDGLYEQHAELRKERDALENDVQDLLTKRDAAVRELEDANTIIKQQEGHIDDLRKQIAVGVRGAIQVDASEALRLFKEQRQQEEEAKPAIYDVQDLDNRRSQFGAKYVETDEYFTDNYMYIGKYRVISEEEARRFRQAREEEERNKPVAPAVESDLAVEVPAPPMPFQGDQPEQQSDHADADGTNVEHGGKEVTLEERVAKLEAAVFGWSAVA